MNECRKSEDSVANPWFNIASGSLFKDSPTHASVSAFNRDTNTFKHRF
jgi:hypothetical protein